MGLPMEPMRFPSNEGARISGKSNSLRMVAVSKLLPARKDQTLQNHALECILASSGGRKCKYQIREHLLRRGIAHSRSIGTY